ncbi:DUF6058 family natural product biosynthesis protein [Maritalea sp.]|uniref:DUF6058 family natural product biosynthesis protein n=1 Tax=Maritalea sp. TaxID=2003361 RepID=UPI003EF84724
MLLPYLFSNFYEAAEFCARADCSTDEFAQMQAHKITPNASYQLETNMEVTSYIGVHQENCALQFYPKSGLDWLTLLQNTNITNEADAKQAFTTQFEATKTTLASSPGGKEILGVFPELIAAFDDHQLEATWQHFLDGTYGICTRTGLPDAIFLKQFYVRLIDQMVGQYSASSIPEKSRVMLQKAIFCLDQVEAEFAPHEVTQSSRQRCIIDVRANYFDV